MVVSVGWSCRLSSFADRRSTVVSVSVHERDGDGSRKLEGVGCTELRVIRPATAFAIIKFRSGG
eukprot:2944478-Pleurochrysis_carterae.AAC.3